MFVPEDMPHLAKFVFDMYNDRVKEIEIHEKVCKSFLPSSENEFVHHSSILRLKGTKWESKWRRSSLFEADFVIYQLNSNCSIFTQGSQLKKYENMKFSVRATNNQNMLPLHYVINQNVEESGVGTDLSINC